MMTDRFGKSAGITFSRRGGAFDRATRLSSSKSQPRSPRPPRWKSSGITLVELLVSMAVFVLISAALAAVLFSALGAYSAGKDEIELNRMASFAMERMVRNVRDTTFLLIPNGRRTDSDLLAVSAGIDNDGDGRVDEDLEDDMDGLGFPGIPLVDDDGDGLTDEADQKDDDEDGLTNEDRIDGIDNDGDGSIDEDCRRDINQDGKPGIGGVDDDDDGQIDEGDKNDDDEDGQWEEDPIDTYLFYYDSGSKKLYEGHPVTGITELAEYVEEFRAQYVWGGAGTGQPVVLLTLRLRRPEGQEIELVTRIVPRNILQVRGRRE